MNNKRIIASFLAILMSISCLFNVAFAKTDSKGNLSKEKILLELDGKKIEENENGEIIVNLKDIKEGRGVLKYLGNKNIPEDEYGIWIETGVPNQEAIQLDEYYEDEDNVENEDNDENEKKKCTSINFYKKVWDTEVVYGISDDEFSEYIEPKNIIKKVKIKVITDDSNYVDVSELQKLIIIGEKYISGPLYYKDEYIQKLKTSIEESKKLLETKNIKKEEVDKSISILKSIVEKPIKKEFDKTELNKALKKAQSLNKEDYTKESYEQVKDNLEYINSLEDKYQNQLDVNICADGLNKAIKQLVDISKLRESIIKSEKIKRGTVSEDSWNDFQKSLREAKDTYENKHNKRFTQKEIDNILERLNSSISLLCTSDKSSLKEAIKKLESIKESEFKLESVKGKDKLLKEVQAVYNDRNATQIQVNEAVKTIQDWLGKLEKKYVVYYKTISGQRIELDNSNSIELDLSQSGGKFCLKGDPNLESGKSIFWVPDYDKRDSVAFTNVKDGLLYLNGVGSTTIQLKFTNDSNYIKDPSIVTINLKVKDIPKIEDIKVYMDNKETTNKIYIDGRQEVKLNVKAKFRGENKYKDVSRSIFNYYALDKKDSKGDKGDLGDNKSIIHLTNYHTDSIGIIQSEMAGTTTMIVEFARDGIKKEIPVEVKHVPVKKIIFDVPTEYEYDELGFVPNSYNGIYLRHVLKIEPENATYKGEVNLKFSDESIAFREKRYGDYIKPKKDGTVDVTAYLDTDGKHFEVTKRIKFYRKKKNVEDIQVTNDKLSVKIDEIIPSGIKTIPGDAFNQDFEYVLSKEGIVKIVGNSIKGLNEGTVEILAKSKDENCKKQVKLIVTVLPKGKGRDVKTEVRNTVKEVTPLIQKDTFNFGNEWNILGLSRNDKNLISSKQRDNYLSSIIESMKNGNNLSVESKPTNIEKVVIALSSMGILANNINKEDLLKNIYENPKISNGLNESVFALIALDTLEYSVPDNAKWTRNKLIEEIKRYQNSNGGFGLFDNESVSIDMTAMALQALSTYKDRKDVKPVIEKALNYLRNSQTEYGGFVDSGKENAESAAQVLVALTSLGIDPLNVLNKFGNENYNVITNILSYRNDDGKFKHYKQDVASNEMATMQSYYALVSYLRFMDKKNKLYDMMGENSKVRSKDVKIGNLTSKNEFKAGGNAKITIKATNTSKNNKDVSLIVGVFNKDGKLVNYGITEQTLKGLENVNLTVNLLLDKKENCIIKSFVWDSLNEMTPLSDVIEMKIK